MKYENLFSPIKIGNLELSNRVVHAPTDISTGSSTGEVTDRVCTYYGEVAKGGTGFIVVGASSPDQLTGRCSIVALSVDQDYFIPGLARLAETMHRYGAKCAMQIQHPGRQACYPRKAQISCSDIITNIPGSTGHEIVYAEGETKGKIARAMEVEEIYDLCEKFAEGAWRVQQAGFDAVELHAAHGYMIAQFMSPVTNSRIDRFGGNYENRMRFILEIIDRIHRKCGKDFPVLVRYSAEEWMPGHRTLEESIKIAKTLEDAGVAALDISAGTFEASEAVMDPMYYKEGWNTYAATAVKEAVNIPVITSHTLRTPEYCDRIIADGKADLVGLSRQMIADPYWALKAQCGNEEDIRKCISCLIGCWKESLMIKREMRCAINPAIGDERFLHMDKANKSLDVAIVGGGVAGMEAARIATLRGHKCTIIEKDNELGGILRMCCSVPPKSKMKWYLDWLRRQIDKLGVTVQLRTLATPEILKAYDVVLCGTGAQTEIPNVPGAEKGVKFEDILVCRSKSCAYWPTEGKPDPIQTGERVILWGDHYAATDTAEALGMKGKKLTIVTENKELGAELEPIHKEVLKRRFNLQNGRGLEGIPYKHLVDVHTQTTILEIRDDEVVCIDKYMKKFSIPCDTVVFCKTKENTMLFDTLINMGLKVINMGDSKQVRNVRGAMTDGANAGIMLDEDILMTPNRLPVANLPTDVRLSLEQNWRRQ